MGMDMVTDMDTVMAMRAKTRNNWLLSGVLLSLVSGTAVAQQAIAGSVSTDMSGTAAAGIAENAQQLSTNDTVNTGRTWTIRPRISLTETLTDNANISANSGNGNGKNDLITELAPGIRIEARTARLKAYFDYTLRAQAYAQTDYSRTQNALNTFGTLEAVNNWLFLDFSGIISQQAISAFGTQSTSNTSINNNSTETATYRLSPYIRGQLGGAVDYLLRYNVSTTRANTAQVSDVDLSEWIGQLRGGTPFNNLKWTLDGSQQTADYSLGRKTEAEQLRAMLTYSLFPEFRVSLSGGWESNNYASLDQDSRSTHGYGFDWNPTTRTQLSAFKERRFFGDGHNVNFNHRFPLSSIRFSDTRDVSVLPNQFTSVGIGSIYDLFYPVLANMEPYASLPPGVKESAIENAITNTFGMPANTQVTSSFLTSRATVQRRQQLALALTGVRNTLTLLINRSENQLLLASGGLPDDFAQNNLIRQQGFSLNLSHRLSEASNLNALASRQSSTGSSASTLKATTTMYQVNVSTKLGPKSTGSLGLRRSEFDNSASPYTENALFGTVSFVY